MFNKKISTCQPWPVSKILEKMKEYEKKKPNAAMSTGQFLILNEEPNEDIRNTNIKLLLTLRAFLIECPPVLNSSLELCNLRRSNNNDFVFRDLD